MSIDTIPSIPRPFLWKGINWEPSSKQVEQLIKLQKLIKHWNGKVNLTRLLEGDDFWVNQVFDSIWPIKNELNDPSQKIKCIDVGSGCGFPGLAIAIAMPESEVILLDSIEKKTIALTNIVEELSLQGRVKIKNERAEVIGHDDVFRENFDLAMARAVSNPCVVAEYLIPLLKQQGEGILFIGKIGNIEERKLNKALLTLKANIEKIESIELPYNRGIRHQVRIKKVNKCPLQFPRGIGLPQKHPLGN